MNIASDDDDNELDVEIPTSDGGAAKFAAVEVKSGEEKYNMLLSLKCRLMRHDEGENAWKERGQGEVRVLESKADNKRHTLLVRREVIGKIAAQHSLLPGMSLKPIPNSDKGFCWSTKADYSDDAEGIPETFLIRFASSELAEQFRSVFNTVVAK